METITIEQEQTLTQEINPVVERAHALVIRTSDESLDAQENLKENKSAQKKIKEFFKPMKDAAKAAHQSICDRENTFLEPLEAAEEITKRKVVTFQQEIEQKRREEAARIEAKRQEEERKRREELQRQADAAAAKGKAEKAEALRAAAEEYVAPPVFQAPEPVQAQGTAFKKTWKAEVTDLPLFLKAVAEGRAPLGVISINEAALNAYAKGVKGSMAVPGLRFYEETSMAVRTK